MTENLAETEYIEVIGAREHNLKNLNIKIPRNKLVVITGLSGSGKSSLAFDTIFAEGQRRYLETFSAYVRQFLGGIERPNVDKITGLSPVISIEQKTVNKNPRSTVGTITELYDFLRLFYARVGTAYSYTSGKKMVQFSTPKIEEKIIEQFTDKKVALLAPIIKGRKGHYKELFEKFRKQGFLKARIDGVLTDIELGLKLDRYKIHDIELVVDRIQIKEDVEQRLKTSIETTLKHGKGTLIVLDTETNYVKYYSKNLMCPESGISYDLPEPNSFSFNSPYGSCKKCKGLGEVSEIDLKKVIPNDTLSIKNGGIAALGKYKSNWIFAQIEVIAKQFDFKLTDKIKDIPEDGLEVVLYGSDEKLDIKENSFNKNSSYSFTYEGVINYLSDADLQENSKSAKKWSNEFTQKVTCPECNGYRLNQTALHFKINGKNISEIAHLDINKMLEWLLDTKSKLTTNELKIGSEIIKEIESRTQFLLNVGLDYISLNRSSKTLSGGEAQRIRLATQIGSQLVGVLYILDEPSIGLHQRDNDKLIASLKELRDNGNSVIVVEHDKDMILASDYVIDIGPKAGLYGGEIVSKGTPKQLIDSDSVTSQYLTNRMQIEIPKTRRTGNGNSLDLIGATGHNLKNVSINLPLGKLICVTGVSGSGKSSLINKTLYPILNTFFYKGTKKPLPYKNIKGIENIDKIIEIDQAPIGRTPRSNPATYTNVFTDIRELFSTLPEAKIRGYKPGRFSFNVKGGRCEDCRGAGVRTIEMNFLPDISVPCESCQSKRYNRETLEIRYRGKSINDILDMSISQAVDFFENIPFIVQKIKSLKDVGLGYITLGQPSTTLSGGEAQRVKLASELYKKDTGKTLYILDEPTTGLHFEDINVLMGVINKIVDKGNTVIIIEHNMDVIKCADHIIDIGIEGGEKGGYVVCNGTPEEVAENKESYTAKYLKLELKN